MRRRKINPTPDQLSDVEYRAMIFIEDYLTARRRSPMVREIQAAIGLSLGATHDLISRLVGYGYLARQVGWKRNLRLLQSLQAPHDQADEIGASICCDPEGDGEG